MFLFLNERRIFAVFLVFAQNLLTREARRYPQKRGCRFCKH
jgi:hypothetical protein